MAEKPIRPQARLLEPNLDEVDNSAVEPVTPQSEEQTAMLAALSGVPLNNRSVSTFISEISNSAFAATIQGASQ